MPEPIKIIYMGTPDFAVPPLRAILGDLPKVEVRSVVTQPVRGKGRGRKPAPSPVEVFAREQGLKVWTPKGVREVSFVKKLRAEVPDLIIVVAYGQILPVDVLSIPRKGCVNLHASLLPLYRGAAPVNRVIMDGSASTGNTTMLMDEGMDTGPILLQERLAIGEDETAEELKERLSTSGAALLVRTIREMTEHNLTAIAQDDSLATYAPSLTKTEGLIDWKKSAEAIKNLVRGVYPWPGAYTFRGGKVLKVHEARACPAEASAGKPGAILRVEKESFFVAAGNGFLEILSLQPENKKKMSAGAFIQGYKPVVGEVLG